MKLVNTGIEIHKAPATPSEVRELDLKDQEHVFEVRLHTGEVSEIFPTEGEAQEHAAFLVRAVREAQ